MDTSRQVLTTSISVGLQIGQESPADARVMSDSASAAI